MFVISKQNHGRFTWYVIYNYCLLPIITVSSNTGNKSGFMTPVLTSAAQRTKRQKTDKHGRFSALEKLKQLKDKNSKHKYDVDELENVYDTIDEREYSERVLQRQEDDWIEDGMFINCFIIILY